MPVPPEMNPYRTGEPADPMLAYFGRLMEWDDAKMKLQAVQATRPQDWKGGSAERDAAMTAAEVEVDRRKTAIAEMKCHIASLFVWMKGIAEYWYAEDIFAAPSPEAFAIWQRAAAKWKADVIENAQGKSDSVKVRDERPLWQRVRDGDTVIV